MRRPLASWAALLGVVAFVCLPLAALAQRRGGVPFGLNWNRGRPATSALLSMALTGNCEGTTPAGLTFTRTSTATCTRADGNLTTVAAGQPRLESQGLLVEGAATNLALRSGELDVAPWSASNMTAQADAGPALGVVTLERLTRGATTSSQAADSQGVSAVAAGTVVTLSAYVSAGSPGAYVYLFNLLVDGGFTGVVTFNPDTGAFVCTGSTYTGKTAVEALPGGVYRVSITGTVAASPPANRVDVGVTTNLSDGSGGCKLDGTAGAYAHVGGAQLEAGPVATSYIPTQGTQVTRAADVASSPNPRTNTAEPWCWGVTGKPNGLWNSSTQRMLASTGVHGTAGYQYLSLEPPSVGFLVNVGGPSGGSDHRSVRTTYSALPADSSSHRVVGAYSATGVGAIWLDGVALTVTTSGPGDGLANPILSPVRIGSYTNNSIFFGGHLSNLVIGNTVGGCQ